MEHRQELQTSTVLYSGFAAALKHGMGGDPSRILQCNYKSSLEMAQVQD
jgi:hypothetical protein